MGFEMVKKPARQTRAQGQVRWAVHARGGARHHARREEGRRQETHCMQQSCHEGETREHIDEGRMEREEERVRATNARTKM